MLQAFFHAWERRLASVTKDRVVRPFEWGLDWIPENGHRPEAPPLERIDEYVSRVMADTDAFFTPAPTEDYHLQPAADGDLLTFPSALVTPHESNNTVRCRYFPANVRDGLKAVPYESDANSGSKTGSNVGHGLQAVPSSRAAVLVMPQWNSDAGGHVGLCKLLAWNGMSAFVSACRVTICECRRTSRRLHRPRQSDADAAGCPAGRARCAAGGAWLKQRGYKRVAFSAPVSARVSRVDGRAWSR
jgi:hypothetical protein